MTPAGPVARLKKGRFARAVLTLTAAGAVGHLILLAAMPLVTRLYEPGDFGLFAVFHAVLALVLVGSSLRYELAIPLPRGGGQARAVLVLALALNAGTTVLSALLVWLFGPALATALGVPALAPVLWMLPVVLLGAGSYRALRFWAVRLEDFDAIARTRIVQSAANAAVQIGGGLAGLGVTGLVAGQFLGYSAGTFRLARGAGLRPSDLTARPFRTRLRVLARRYARFPRLDVGAALVNTAGTQLPNLLLAGLFGPAVAGFYLLADRALGTPLSLLGQSVGQVLYARAREAAETGALAGLATRLVLLLGAAIALPAVAVFLFGEPLFALVFGAGWAEAGRYAGWLMIGLCAQFLYSSISLVLMATGGQHLNLLIQLVMLACRTGALVYGYLMGSALAGIVAFALVGGLGYLGASALVIAHARASRLNAASGRTP